MHSAIRADDTELVKNLLEKNGGGAKLLCVGKNIYGRCALHIAVLKENEEIVEHIANLYPETLRIGDNVGSFNLKKNNNNNVCHDNKFFFYFSNFVFRWTESLFIMQWLCNPLKC